MFCFFKEIAKSIGNKVIMYIMLQKLKDHIYLSKNIRKCKNCKHLFMECFFDQIYCNDCEKKYTEILNKIT
jgi:hypothetical protein